MSHRNLVLLVGNVGAAPELRRAGETAVVSLSLATTAVWKDAAGEKRERTEWHRVTFWGRLAENVSQYVRKGDRLDVAGEIRYTKWTDKDGQERYSTDIHAHECIFPPRRSDR